MCKVAKSFLQICQTVYPFYIVFTVSDCVQLRAIDVGVACLAQRHSGGRTRAQTYLTPINPPLSYILLALHIAQAYLTHIYPLLSTYIRHSTLQNLNSALSTPIAMSCILLALHRLTSPIFTLSFLTIGKH